MSDHEFEKQVRQKLNSLKITPSAEAWEKIEERLRERRRRTALWLPLLAVVFLVAGYFGLHDSGRHQNALSSVEKSQTGSPVAGSNGNGLDTHRADGDSVKNLMDENPQTKNVNGVSKDERAEVSLNGVARPSVELAKGPIEKSLKDNRGKSIYGDQLGRVRKSDVNDEQAGITALGAVENSRNTKDVTGIRDHPEFSKGAKADQASRVKAAMSNGIVVHDQPDPYHKKSTGRTSKNDLGVQQLMADSSVVTPFTSTTEVPVSATHPSKSASGIITPIGSLLSRPLAHQWTASAVRMPMIAYSTDRLLPLSRRNTSFQQTTARRSSNSTSLSKWSYAISASGGVSAVNGGGLFGFNNPKVEDIAASNNFAAPVASYVPVYKASTISPGFAFSAGVEAKRELSKRFSLSMGVSYAQFNTRTMVGDRIDGSNIVNNGARGYLYVQSYYLIDQNEKNEHANKYHFIEVPVTLHTRINQRSRLPLYWNAGVVVSRLLSSTSLHFDGTTGVYYKNDRLLNQTQAGLSTGFSAVLFNHTAHPLWIGPSARSNMSTILKKDISTSQHFVSVGLDLRWYLRK